ncbi:heavy metal-associated domain-containing protein [Nocardioides sp. BP30]|uniref:heavy-metal-associated domain-containing protein n=1 Tax=Nocardioides sp. BP30 TaxID=3036374 RepID=UPI0024698575|nr:heavy metal-associated domain-containing protein [Nocardioides sp. BP30]WGL52087.1 heavy metal-associated domain-containing protein [Nocardioides sp. BP30]
MSTFEGTVEGMTCQHCVASVSEEVSALPGVSAVEVDLASGGLRVTSDVPLEREDVARAVVEAGYALR